MKNRKPHQIELSELQNWLLENKALYASDGNKRLLVNMSGGFEITVKNEVVWEGMQPFAAVEKYNDLP